MDFFKKHLGTSLVQCWDGAEVPTTDHFPTERYIGIYFGASTCKGCAAFTPELKACYAKLNASELNFQVVMVSSDNSPQAYIDGIRSQGPWLALPLTSKAERKALTAAFAVRVLPTLVILDKDGNTVTAEGVRMLREDQPAGFAHFPWATGVGDQTEDAAANENGAAGTAAATGVRLRTIEVEVRGSDERRGRMVLHRKRRRALTGAHATVFCLGGQSMQSWAGVCAALDEQYSYVILDGTDSHKLDSTEQLCDLIEVFKQTSTDVNVLCASGMDTALAMRLAGSFTRNNTSGLVLIGTGFEKPPPMPWLLRLLPLWLLTLLWSALVAPFLIGREFKYRASWPPQLDAVRTAAIASAQKVGPREYLRRHEAVRWMTRELAANILVPVRILTGRYDRVSGVRQGQQLADRLVAGEAVVVERAGHCVMEERPADVARHVEELCRVAILGEAREHEATKYGKLSE